MYFELCQTYFLPPIKPHENRPKKGEQTATHAAQSRYGNTENLLLALEVRQRKVESHGEQADCYHAGTAHNAGRHAAQPDVHACKVGQAAEHAGRGVYLLAKDERLDVDEHVAEHSAGRTRHRTHYDCRPPGKAQRQGFLHARNGEHSQPYGVEKKPRVVLAYERLAEHGHPKHGESRTHHIRGRLHPERRKPEH